MSGRVPPSSKSKTRAARSDAVSKAASRFKRFTGHDAESMGRMTIPNLPKVVAAMGELDAVMYSTVRDGKHQKFIHKFNPKDKPLLCVTPDGKQILVIGGRYTWTERGIVDKHGEK